MPTVDVRRRFLESNIKSYILDDRIIQFKFYLQLYLKSTVPFDMQHADLSDLSLMVEWLKACNNNISNYFSKSRRCNIRDNIYIEFFI